MSVDMGALRRWSAAIQRKRDRDQVREQPPMTTGINAMIENINKEDPITNKLVAMLLEQGLTYNEIVLGLISIESKGE